MAKLAAAYAAGHLSTEDCLRIAYHRGRLSDSLKKTRPDLNGSMMALGLSCDRATTYLAQLGEHHEVVVACINSPNSVTVSGDETGIAQLEALLRTDNVFVRRLKVTVAYHSPHMGLIADEYYESIKDVEVKLTNSETPMVSTVTTSLIEGSQLNATYWVRNMVSPVKFSQAFETLLQTPSFATRHKGRDGQTTDILLEIGPHGALKAPLTQILSEVGRADRFDYFSLLSREENAAATSLEAAGRLWTKGVAPSISKANMSDASPQQLMTIPDLPRYPWK